jgi:glutamate synthase (NADPH/NADH) small chain
MEAYKFPQADTPIKIGKKVAVIGGGNTAMDAARTALRMATKKVYCIYRRTKKEMPAREEEIRHAEEEGIEFIFLASPVRYIGNKDNQVEKAELVRMKLGKPDESGRAHPEPIRGSEFTIEVDSVIIAIGTVANPLITQTDKDIKTNKSGYIKTDSKGRTTKKRVYAGGDIVTGSATVIEAMAAGKKVARTIAEDLTKEKKALDTK